MATKTKKTRATKARSPLSPATVPFKLVPSPRGGTMLALRKGYKLNRDLFARMLPVSTRSLATIESGQPPTEAVKRRLTELRRIFEALSEVVEPNAIGEWMTVPNDAFDGLKPLEVIERGEVDRIWRMIFALRSGVAV